MRGKSICIYIYFLYKGFLFKELSFELLFIPSPTKLQRDIVTVMLPSVRPSHPCEHSRINILQWILTKLGTYLVFKRIWNRNDFQGHMSMVKVTGSIFLQHNILVNTLESILQWILTKLGTYLVLKRIWNPIDFQGHMSKVKVTGTNCLQRNILVNTLKSTFYSGF